MNVVFSQVGPDDIVKVASGIWRRGEEEAEAFGLEKSSIIQYLIEASKEHGFVMKVHDEPIAVFGASRAGDHYNSWFIATNRFEEVGKAATRFLKGFVSEKITQHPDAELRMVSGVSHPDAERWFKLLGFEFINKEGPFSHYIYRRENRLTPAQK